MAELQSLGQRLQGAQEGLEALGVAAQMEPFLRMAEVELSAVRASLGGLKGATATLCDFLCEEPETFSLAECCRVFQAFGERFLLATQVSAALDCWSPPRHTHTHTPHCWKAPVFSPGPPVCQSQLVPARGPVLLRGPVARGCRAAGGASSPGPSAGLLGGLSGGGRRTPGVLGMVDPPPELTPAVWGGACTPRAAAGPWPLLGTVGVAPSCPEARALFCTVGFQE